jgi:hypothetical protein
MSVTLNLTSAAVELARTANGIDVKPGAVAGSWNSCSLLVSFPLKALL